jgi:isoquinoline 1-oxidoreductase beta subunit
MVMGGSWAVFQSYVPMSQAGAASRKVLIKAAAKLLGVQAGDCKAQNSQVTCGDQSISSANIINKDHIDRKFSPEELAHFTPKNPKDRQLISKPSKALDIPAKSTRTAEYGIDVEIEGMVYALPLIPPTRYGSRVPKINDSKANSVKGYLGFEILQGPSNLLQGWVSVLADTYYGAISAAQVIEVEYQAGETANVNEQDLINEGEKLVTDKSTGRLFVDHGDIDKTAAEAKKSIDSTYRTASALHFALEPVNAVVEFKDSICHVYTGNQWQSLFLPVVAKSVGLSYDNVTIHQYYLGGGFGRRLTDDYMIPAALTAKAIDKPVKLVFTREDDSRFDCIRSPSVQHFAAY